MNYNNTLPLDMPSPSLSMSSFTTDQMLPLLTSGDEAELVLSKLGVDVNQLNGAKSELKILSKRQGQLLGKATNNIMKKYKGVPRS